MATTDRLSASPTRSPEHYPRPQRPLPGQIQCMPVTLKNHMITIRECIKSGSPPSRTAGIGPCIQHPHSRRDFELHLIAGQPAGTNGKAPSQMGEPISTANELAVLLQRRRFARHRRALPLARTEGPRRTPEAIANPQQVAPISPPLVIQVLSTSLFPIARTSPCAYA
jgi:hypothetical protein